MREIDWSIVKVLPTDYTDYGGAVERWKDGDDYPDCSSGCCYFLPLEGALGSDWGVCSKPGAPRQGLLTWEHQTGRGCFEADNGWYDGRASRNNMTNPGNLDYDI